jgi:hypothetical protein
VSLLLSSILAIYLLSGCFLVRAFVAFLTVSDSGNGTINAEVNGRTTQIEVNADGTKTMLTG